jgi:ATP-dependent RNA helicase DeaD
MYHSPFGGKDVIGQAQTGTGKTAAFSLPLLDNIDVKSKNVQVLVLAPTRELAIQVSEAMKTYSKGFKDLSVLSIYGGQSYDIQLKALKRGGASSGWNSWQGYGSHQS